MEVTYDGAIVTADAGSTGALARFRAPVALALLGGVLLLVGVIGFVQGGGEAIRRQEPIDLDLNLVAGQRLLDREPLYDQDASRTEAVEMGGRALEGSYTSLTNGFPGAPTTALLHAPFSLLDHRTGVAVYRIAALVGMLAAVGLTVLSLPTGSRTVGALLGVGGLVASTAFFQTLHLGQGHEFVMLGLAAGIWGASKERWGLAGAGLGVATVLKISPVLLLVYLLVRGKRRSVASAMGAAATLCLAAAALGRPGDLVVWVRDVVPSLSGGVARGMNQSLPGYLARVFTDQADLGLAQSLGAWRFMGLPMVVAALVVLARDRRDRPVDPLELGILLIVALVAGPLSWVHYSTSAVLPLVLLADQRRWRGLTPVHATAVFVAITTALLLLTTVVAEPEAASFAQRLTSGPNLVAEVALFGASFFLLRRNPIERPGPTQPAPGWGVRARPSTRPGARGRCRLLAPA